MPTFGLYVRDDWEFMKEFSLLIKSQYDDKESPYLREVVERDLTERRDAKADLSPTALVDLARDVLGKIGAREMQRVTVGVDQGEELANLLRRYIAEHAEKPKHNRVTR